VSNLPHRLSDIQAPRDGGKSAEYELAEQDESVDESRRAAGAGRPDLRAPRGNPPVEDYDLERGREQLERVIAK
jgi:hypothetical protein